MTDIYGLNLPLYQDKITAEVERLYGDEFEVIEDTLADDQVMYRDFRGQMPAYIILRYGPMMPKRRGRTFAGPKQDEYYGTVDVIAVAAQGKTSRRLAAAVANDLLGWKPDGTAPMILQDDGGMFAAFVVTNNEVRPTRTMASQRMRFNVNNRDVGQTARPQV